MCSNTCSSLSFVGFGLLHSCGGCFPISAPATTQDAIKFARHSKRSHITSADVNNALRMRNVRPIYGFSDSRNPARFVQAVGHPDVFYAEDPIVPVASEIEKPLRPPPWETAVRPHWLAINGKQPALPENTPLQPSHRAKRQRTAAPAVPVPAAAPAAAPPASGAPADTAGAAAGEEGALVRAPLRHMVSQELHLYFNKVKALLAPGRQQAEDGNNSNEEATQEAAAAAVAESPEGATPSAETRAVLASLRRNAGLQPLAPYLSHLIAQGIADNMQHPRRLSLLLRYSHFNFLLFKFLVLHVLLVLLVLRSELLYLHIYSAQLTSLIFNAPFAELPTAWCTTKTWTWASIFTK